MSNNGDFFLNEDSLSLWESGSFAGAVNKLQKDSKDTKDELVDRAVRESLAFLNSSTSSTKWIPKKPATQQIPKPSKINFFSRDSIDSERALPANSRIPPSLTPRKNEKISSFPPSYSCEFKSGEKSFGTQTLSRINMKDRHINMMQNRIEFLEKEIRGEKAGSQTKTYLRELDLCREEMRNIQDLESDFIPSGYVREMLKNSKDAKFEEKIDQICKGALVNQRYNEIEIDGKMVGGHCDLGVIAYQPNCLTNLKEMKDMQADETLLKKKQLELEKKEKLFSKKNDNAVTATAFAKNQLKNKENLSLAIEERRFYLSSQFLHLLNTQTEKNKSLLENLGEGAPFTMLQLSLLNPKNVHFDPTGWMHDETNQMMDMLEIFKEFDGKTLVFDGRGPYVDLEGKVHLPLNLKGKEIKLEAIFLNISVQGHKKNDGMQREINKLGMARLLSRMVENNKKAEFQNSDYSKALEQMQELNSQLEAGKSSYLLAESLGGAVTKQPIALGINCLSAKDRTGYVSSRVILRHLNDYLDEKVVQGRQKIKRRFNSSILKKGSCALQNVFENTRSEFLKCTPFHLPGYSPGVKGAFRRAKYYGVQARGIIRGRA